MMEPTHETSLHKSATSGRKVLWRLAALGALASIAAVTGVKSRESAESRLARWTQEQAVPTVGVVVPRRGIGNQELVLPGDVEAWFKAPIYSRVDGYVKMWYKDYGAPVKTGDVLAEIETPDLDQKLAQARADLDKATAQTALSELTARRWKALQNSNAVSQQDIDDKTGAYQAQRAAEMAARAYVGQLEAFEGYKKLSAPFDGVVTARKIDVGALVQASASNMPDLFEISDIHRMRIFVQIPQMYAAQLQNGMKAHFKLAQFPDKTFHAVVATTSHAITKGSRTLLVELHCDNKDGLIEPGSYAEVYFEIPPDQNALILPASALLFRQAGAQVAVVGADDRITLKKITIGRDLGTDIEVSAGLSADDKVVQFPSDSINSNDRVRIGNPNLTPMQVSVE